MYNVCKVYNACHEVDLMKSPKLRREFPLLCHLSVMFVPQLLQQLFC